MEIKGKKILVLGLGRSGVGAANLLSGLGAEVTVTDRKPEGELMEYLRQLSPSVKRCLGGYPDRVNGTDLVVVSPGVPLEIAPIAAARDKGVRVIGELEVAYEITRAGGKGVPFLGITGSNGKSTTTTLLDAMLRKGGLRTLLGGNIGNALTEELLKSAGAQAGDAVVPNAVLPGVDFVVAEVSSFQLESIEEFRPAGAAILNITPDHMDRYHSMDEYAGAKAAIFRNQGSGDFLVLNADDPGVREVETVQLRAKSERPRVFHFSRREETMGIYLKNGRLHVRFPGPGAGSGDRVLIEAEEIRIKGVHNLENAMAASAMALLAGCPADAVRAALREFPGLEHRLEFVRELEGVRYMNDSKGTNVGAVMKSLAGFHEPVILIAGGRDKAGDFGQLRPLVREKVKALILIGEAAEKIGKALGDLTATVFSSDLRDAVGRARELAGRGDVVLLSPACASFDMFRDFEDRGRQFKMIVRGLS